MPFELHVFAAALCVVFLAAFVRSSFGFGDAMVGMPLLSILIGVRTATPLVAMTAATVATLILFRERESIDFKSVGRLIVTAMLAIPLGVYGLSTLPELVVKGLLGVVVFLFAAINLSRFEMPELKNDRAAYAFGFFAGLLGGAYNTQGPPLVMYATMRRWPRAQFRANLQSVLLPTCIFILANHWWQGLWKPAVYWTYLAGLPLVLAALPLGRLFSKRMQQRTFVRSIFVLLAAVGLLLIANVLWSVCFGAPSPASPSAASSVQPSTAGGNPATP